MALLSLDKAKIEESFGVIQKTANTDVAAAVDELAAVLMPQATSNAVVDKVIEQCKAVQTKYNEEYLPSIRGLMDDFQNTFDIADYLATKADAGEASKASVGYKNSGISADDVVV